MKVIKNIVVAIDFASNSINTYNYALGLAARFNAALTVVNVFDPIVYNYLTTPSIPDFEKEIKEDLVQFVHADTDTHGDTLVAKHTKIKTQVLVGSPADTLIAYSKDASTDLLILGTIGEKDWVDRLFGGVALKVMQEAHCPVLLVPKEAQYKGIHNLLYAASPDSAANKDVNYAIDFAEYFIAAIHFIHVNATIESPKNDTMTQFKNMLLQKSPRLPYSIENIKASTIAEGINTYCLTNPVDLVVTVTHHRGFWESLMHYSTSKELGWYVLMPILCLHRDDK